MGVPTRGCGRRVAGGVYAVCGTSPFGMPVEHFLIDYKALNPDLGVAAVGVSLIDLPKQPTMVFDWVGSEHYPNVADFVEEVRRFGMSRRLPKNLDYTRIVEGSRQVLCHARAIILNAEDYQKERMGVEEGYLYCPKNIAEHRPLDYRGMCASLWWEDVDGDDEGQYHDQWPRHIKRNQPEFSYEAWARPANVKGRYQPGLFASFPIHKLQVIADPNSGTHEEALDRTRHSNVPVELVPE